MNLGSKLRKSRLRSTFSKRFRFRCKISKTSISVNIFEKNSISVQNFGYLGFGQYFQNNFNFGSKFRKSRFWSTLSKKFQFRLKISKLSFSINIFEKNSISVQNFRNLICGQHFRKNFDFDSKFRKSRFPAAFSKKFDEFGSKFGKSWFQSKISQEISISIQNFENLDLCQHIWKEKIDFGSKS